MEMGPVRVISRRKLRLFWGRHANAESPLRTWETIVKAARWASFQDVRNTFGKTVDRYNKCYVFNIHGNDYRLIAEISKDWKRLYVRHILTHREYDDDRWKAKC